MTYILTPNYNFKIIDLYTEDGTWGIPTNYNFTTADTVLKSLFDYIDLINTTLAIHMASNTTHGAIGQLLGTLNTQTVENKTIDALNNTLRNIGHINIMVDGIWRDNIELDYDDTGSLRAEDIPYDVSLSIKDKIQDIEYNLVNSITGENGIYAIPSTGNVHIGVLLYLTAPCLEIVSDRIRVKTDNITIERTVDGLAVISGSITNNYLTPLCVNANNINLAYGFADSLVADSILYDAGSSVKDKIDELLAEPPKSLPLNERCQNIQNSIHTLKQLDTPYRLPNQIVIEAFNTSAGVCDLVDIIDTTATWNVGGYYNGTGSIVQTLELTNAPSSSPIISFLVTDLEINSSGNDILYDYNMDGEDIYTFTSLSLNSKTSVSALPDPFGFYRLKLKFHIPDGTNFYGFGLSYEYI